MQDREFFGYFHVMESAGRFRDCLRRLQQRPIQTMDFALLENTSEQIRRLKPECLENSAAPEQVRVIDYAFEKYGSSLLGAPAVSPADDHWSDFLADGLGEIADRLRQPDAQPNTRRLENFSDFFDVVSGLAEGVLARADDTGLRISRKDRPRVCASSPPILAGSSSQYAVLQ